MRTIIIPILLLFICCDSKTEQNANYYFPVKNFLAETTYSFVNQNDPSEKSNWTMKTIVSNNDTLLQTSIFDGKWSTPAFASAFKCILQMFIVVCCLFVTHGLTLADNVSGV